MAKALDANASIRATCCKTEKDQRSFIMATRSFTVRRSAAPEISVRSLHPGAEPSIIDGSHLCDDARGTRTVTLCNAMERPQGRRAIEVLRTGCGTGW